ncbi:MAG: hypothetical protein CMJ18_13300 [Phycisphaeraceae bacterium]|nr:hypothetical protein [Phycisphaeraceae bacterium]
MFQRLMATWIMTGLAAAVAPAAMLEVSTDAPPGSPLSVFAGSPSGPLVVSVTNDVGQDATSDLLTGWQVTLEIHAQSGATGSLEFASVVNPSNYLLDGVPHINFPGSMNTTTRHQLSGVSLAGAVQVPTAPGAGLMEITLEASADASGTFGLLIVDGADSQWTDNRSPLRLEHDYANVPASGGLVRIGEVQIIVPEPGGVASLLVIGVTRLPRSRRHH